MLLDGSECAEMAWRWALNHTIRREDEVLLVRAVPDEVDIADVLLFAVSPAAHATIYDNEHSRQHGHHHLHHHL